MPKTENLLHPRPAVYITQTEFRLPEILEVSYVQRYNDNMMIKTDKVYPYRGGDTIVYQVFVINRGTMYISIPGLLFTD